MNEAYQLSLLGRVSAPPNPWVGCVITTGNGDEVVGRGYHVKPGMPHAEIVALQEAGEKAKGATLFVTLEPCCHQGRTGPCVDAIVKAGIAKVVFAMYDPDPKVSGKGAQALRDKGIQVVHEYSKEVNESLNPYLHHRRTGMPYVVLKTAMSIDGHSSRQDGKSKWITGAEARADVQRLRTESQAVLVGLRTALLDNPLLTVRNNDFKSPLRVVIDRRGDLTEGHLLDQKLGRTLILTTPQVKPESLSLWNELGIEVVVGELEDLLSHLGSLNIIQLLVEGGSHTQDEFIRRGLAHEWIIYRGNVIIGSQGVKSCALDINDLECRLQLCETKVLGNDVMTRYTFETPAECKLHTHMFGEWRFRCYSNGDRVLIKGKPRSGDFVRVHSDCFTGDVLHSCHCDCGEQLNNSLSLIDQEGRGVVIFPANHEGRGIGIYKKVRAYQLIQEAGLDTYQANLALGHREDERDYSNVKKILIQLGLNKIRILTNNKYKVKALEEFIEAVVPIDGSITPQNQAYMNLKIATSGFAPHQPNQDQ